MKETNIFQLSRRKFLGVGSAVLSFAAWRSLRLGGSPRSLALSFYGFSNRDGVRRLERTLRRFPHVQVTLLPTSAELYQTIQADPQLWTRLQHAGHEVAYAASGTSLEADFSTWQALLGRTPRFTADLQHAPTMGLAAHGARHDLLIAAWQPWTMLVADEVVRRQSVLISAETTPIQTITQLLEDLTAQAQPLVTLSTLSQQQADLIEPLTIS